MSISKNGQTNHHKTPRNPPKNLLLGDLNPFQKNHFVNWIHDSMMNASQKLGDDDAFKQMQNVNDGEVLATARLRPKTHLLCCRSFPLHSAVGRCWNPFVGAGPWSDDNAFASVEPLGL